MSNVEVRSCEECGASIYPEHLGANKAGYWGGRLVCVHCFTRHQSEQVTIEPGEVTALGGDAEAPPDSGMAGDPPVEAAPSVEEEGWEELSTTEDLPMPAGEPAGDDEGISMESLARTTTKITPFGSSNQNAGSFTQQRYKRHLHHDGKGSIRCRIVHAKLNDGALKFVEDQINNWIDQNPEVEIKHVNTNVGVVEGKSSEPHLIITLFY